MWGRGRRGWLPVVSVLVVGGCGQAPTAELERAYEAQARAAEVGGGAYSPQGWGEVVSYRAALDTELARQENRPSFLRSYRHVSELSDSLRIMAEAVSTMARERHYAFQGEATTLLTDGPRLLAEIRADLAAVPAGRASPSELARLRSAVDSAETALEEARADLGVRRFLEARDRASAAVHRLYEVRDSLQGLGIPNGDARHP
jgi:hypothetical protein